ncbi:protein RTF2 homolog [Melanaphis sacchari]|uniref:Replication termination factor 2 n=1 Tax=Melanaphis sacchari TaxID=742174 RepID=A0A2H8TTS9_9HEMI|nr:protein RTF2 homolog [Melanaphis sacchari]
MGCDGGTIPKRDELVRTKKKPEQKDKSSMQLYRWRNCHLTQGPLRPPIVACGMGLLYNKESVLQYLVNKTPFPEASAHIKSLKDIKALRLTPNPAFNGKAQSVGGYIDNNCSPFICPLVGLEMNDRSKFCFLWKCGCVISERGLKLGADNKCVNCVMEYEDDDIVVLNPTEEDIALMKTKLAKRKDKIKSKKNKVKQEVVVKEEPVDEEEKPIIPPILPIKTENDIKKEIKKEQIKKEQIKRPIPSAAGSSSSVTSANCRKLEDPVYKKAKLTHSISKDQTATNVYKSLFTSHEDDKNQTRAHWITYNPFYN